MKLLRNIDFAVTLALFTVVTIIAALFMKGSGYSLAVLILGLAMMSIYIVSSYFHYKRISNISAEIDAILHGSNELLTDCNSEGELSLLRSEIYKMTVRLREQSQRLNADKIYLADSLADISHQIRTPLTAINILLTMLTSPDTSHERRRQLIQELQELLSRIDQLITVLLKISKLDAGAIGFRQDNCLLSELIDNASRPLLIPMELRCQQLITEADGSFTGDMQWMCEAVGNIIKNCTEHTPEGGTIRITASENTIYSEIIISDTGRGISANDLPHIFERFYKGSDSGEKSFGIGLSLARMIISAHNGTVKAENVSSGGARFTVRLYKSTGK